MGQGHRVVRASKFSLFGLLSLSILSAAVISATPAAAQSNIGVYVSYADSARADATNFPTPWFGSPNTTFEGCQPVAACAYDGGAIRVVNNSPSPVTVDSITVHFGGACTYTGWPSAQLTAGADLIVTQLASGEGSGCTGPTPIAFDTSDLSFTPTGTTDVCTNDQVQATVDVMIDGTTTSYTDSGQVLNNGGIDPPSCPGVANESSQWTVIGTGPCRGSLLTLSPATQSDPVLSNATITARFANSCGQALSNTLVSFNATTGVNAGMTGSGVTDANGNASWTYSSAQVGTDTWQATIATGAGPLTSNSVLVNWTVSFAPGGGAFVISDLDLKDVMGGPAYWWGAQWWKNDHLSTGLAPASFKGYENSNASPWCGQTWTTRPGNSSKPPKAVAANTDMAVIVSSAITKSGPTISGDIVAIVLVRTNPGYGPNPGHPGTGTIIATLCSQSAAQPAPQSSGSNGHHPAATGSSRPAASPTSTPLPATTTSGEPAPVAPTSSKPGNGKGSGSVQGNHGRGH